MATEELGFWRKDGSNGEKITSLSMRTGDTYTVYYTSAVDLTNATFTLSDTDAVSIIERTIGTIYYWKITLKAISPATNVQLTVNYTSGNTEYYKTLSITIKPLTIQFYRHHAPQDLTLYAEIEQKYGELVKIPVPPDPPTDGRRFYGWWDLDEASQLHSYDTMSSSIEAGYIARWETPVKGNIAFFSDGNQVTGVNINLGETKTIEINPNNPYKIAFTSLDPSIANVESAVLQNFFPSKFEIAGVSTGNTSILVTYSEDDVLYYAYLTITVVEPVDIFTVSINAGDGGQVSPTSIDVVEGTTWTSSSNILSFSDGQEVTATPSSGYAFSSWSLPSGTVDSTTSISATFVKSTTNYNISFRADQGGTVNQTILSVPAGTTWTTSGRVLTLSTGHEVTATANSGYKFRSWTPSSGTVTSNNTEVTAYFSQAVTYDLSFESEDTRKGTVSPGTYSIEGNVTVVSSGHLLKIGSDIITTATPVTGYALSNWTYGDGNVLSIGESVEISAATTFRAIFTSSPAKFTVTINPGVGGAVDVRSVPDVPYGTAIIVTGNSIRINETDIIASPEEGYVFDGWSNVEGLITAPREIIANFVTKVYRVSFKTNLDIPVEFNPPELTLVGEYTVSQVGVGLSFADKEELWSIVPPTVQGYVFSTWVPEGGTFESDMFFKANYTPVDTFVVSFVASPPGSGTFSPSDTVSNVAPGTSVEITEDKSTVLIGDVSITRVPSEGYRFVGWEDAYGPVNASMTITAIFESVKVISVHFNANSGSVTPSSKTVIIGEPYGPLPTPIYAGYNFEGWYLDDSSELRVTEDTIVSRDTNHTLYAHWESDASENVGTWHLVNTTGDEVTSLYLDSGTEQQLVFVADKTSYDIRNNNKVTINYVSSSIKSFEITYDSFPPNVRYYKIIKIKGIRAGYADLCISWTRNGIQESSKLRVYVDWKHMVTAVATCMGSSSGAGDGGVVTPASAEVTHGGSQTFTCEPREGYSIKSVWINGEKDNTWTPQSEYTLRDVMEPTAVEFRVEGDVMNVNLAVEPVPTATYDGVRAGYINIGVDGTQSHIFSNVPVGRRIAILTQTPEKGAFYDLVTGKGVVECYPDEGYEFYRFEDERGDAIDDGALLTAGMTIRAVFKEPIYSISIEPDVLSLDVGSEPQGLLTVQYSPKTPRTKSVTWVSSNTLVAAVSGQSTQGTVKARAAGNTTVTATAANGTKGTAQVTVTGGAGNDMTLKLQVGKSYDSELKAAGGISLVNSPDETTIRGMIFQNREGA